MYQYTECRISYQLVTFIHFQSRIFAAAKKINIVFMKDSIDFGNMEIPRLFEKLLIPTVLGMVFSAVFVITDGIFVGKGIGSDALGSGQHHGSAIYDNHRHRTDVWSGRICCSFHSPVTR